MLLWAHSTLRCSFSRAKASSQVKGSKPSANRDKACDVLLAGYAFDSQANQSRWHPCQVLQQPVQTLKVQKM